MKASTRDVFLSDGCKMELSDIEVRSKYCRPFWQYRKAILVRYRRQHVPLVSNIKLKVLDYI